MQSKKYRIEKFDPARHVRAGFSCGAERIDNYFHKSMKAQDKGEMITAYVLCESAQNNIQAFSTLNVGNLDWTMIPNPSGKLKKAIPAHGEVPALFLSRMGTRIEFQDKKHGRRLMIHAMQKTLLVAEEVGCWALVLDVLDDGDKEAYQKRMEWYKKFGFTPFPSEPSRMFMPVEQIRSILERAPRDTNKITT